MTTEKIQRLIDRFLDGDTTPREEQQLYAYFRRKDVPEELRGYTELFVKLGDTLRPVPAPEVFRPVPESVKARPVPTKKKLSLHRWTAAACIAILLGVGGWLMMGETAQKENPVRDDLCVAQGGRSAPKDAFIAKRRKIPENKKVGVPSSPSGEAYVTVSNDLIAKNKEEETFPKGETSSTKNRNPGMNPRATNRTSLWELKGNESSECKKDIRVSKDFENAKLMPLPNPMQTASPELAELMMECERALLDEEFLKREEELRAIRI